MQILDSIQLPTTAIFQNLKDMENFCRYLEHLDFDVFHTGNFTFPAKCFIEYSLIEKMAVIK